MKPFSPVLPANPSIAEVVYAKDQPQYLQLPACNIQYADGTIAVISRWRLSFKERLRALIFGSVWLETVTHGNPLQPQRITLAEPLTKDDAPDPEPIRAKDEASDDESLLCRTAVAVDPTASGVMMYMPGGMQEITPVDGGIGKPIRVLVEAGGANALQGQFRALSAKGKRPFFDFNHEDGPASFWPEEFFWSETPEPGIYAKGEWTSRGREAVEGKEFRQFSPVFHVDNKRANPARIVARAYADPNMGGLVNNPAFHRILPLWAKQGHGSNNAGAPSENTNKNQAGEKTDMDEKELAALQAKNQELETELTKLRNQQAAIKAKNENDEFVAARIAATEAELRAGKAEADNAALKAKNDEQGKAIAARNKQDADAAVKRAVDRGAIAAKDTDTQTSLSLKASEDPTFIKVIDGLAGQVAMGGRIAAGNVRVVAESPNATMKEYAGIVARNAKLPLTLETSKEKGRLAREAAALFAKEIDGNDVITGMPMEDAIRAADNSDASVGLLSGTLVLQRALPLLQYEYPILSQITSDYSDAPGLLNQTESTRIILKPAVQTFNTDRDSAGRPKGWDTVSPAQAVDVPVTLDEYVGVPIVFGNDTLAQTIRNLFAEVAPMALYALGGYAVNKLTALITAANFNAYKGISEGGGATTDESTTITVTSTAEMYPGQAISGTGIPSNTYIRSVTDATTAVITQAATATNTGLTFTLGGGKVPNLYATYAKALADFNMASLGDIAAAFDTNEVPMNDRFALLNSQYHHRLAQDPTFNTFFAAMRTPETITKGSLPELQGFNPIKAPWFPTSSNRVGFAGHKSSLILKSRLPQDFANAIGAMVPGSVTTVTAPGGFSVLLVQYVSLRENYAEWRPEVMLGAAVGERRSGLVITSA